MAMLSSLSKTLSPTRGPIGQVVMGLGTGTLVNIADKKLLQGKLTAAGVSLGQSINGKPVTLNVTDAITAFVVTGFKVPKSRDLIAVAVTVGAKKLGELYDYIDPPTPMPNDNPNATNVTLANHRRNMEQPPMLTVPAFRGNY